MKMSSYFQLNWGEQKTKLQKSKQKISLTDFVNWIFEVGVSASSINIETDSHTSTSTEQSARRTRNAYVNAHELKSKRNWVVCSEHNLCKQCLKRHNGICNSKIVCSKQGCQIKHHTLLHKSTDDEKVTSKTDENKNNTTNLHAAHSGNVSSEILFKIIPITIYGKDNKTIKTFAFIDEGSSISLINEKIIKELNLTGDPLPLCLKWTGNMVRNEVDSKVVSVQISGSNKTKFSIQARTVKQLSLPSQSLNYKILSERFPHLRGLPIDNFKNAVPNLLLGLNNLKLCVPTRVREGNKHEPVAVCTRLGWLLCGNTGIEQKAPNQYNFHCCECEREDDKTLSSLLKKFFSIEMIGISNSTQVLGKDDQRAMNILENYTRQRSDGHYEVALLWRYDNITLPQSYAMAKKRLICLEKTLRNNKYLFDVFEKTIVEYKKKNK